MKKETVPTKKYKNSEIKTIYVALGGLDGVGKGDNFRAYQFAGDTIERIVRNKLTLRPLILEFDEVEKAFLKSNTKAGSIGVMQGSPEHAKYLDQINEFMAKEREVNIQPIIYKDLNATENMIVPSILEMLISLGVITGF